MMKRLQTDDDGFSMRMTKSQRKERLGFGKEKGKKKRSVCKGKESGSFFKYTEG